MASCLTVGGSPLSQRALPWHIGSDESRVLATKEQSIIDGEFLVEGTLDLVGTSELLVTNHTG